VVHARRIAWTVLVAVAFFGAAVAQTPEKVEFARDVQPILRQHCIGCHGAALHQAGLRLDRRSDAMRGGTTTPGVIHRGDSRSSILYIKISSSQFGPQMPPTGPLRLEQIDIIKRWIDDGAEWPDAAAGEVPPVATPPLMTAVLARDRATVRRLLDAGADPSARNGAGATALLWAADDLEMTRLLLEYGADVTARSDDGRTAILAATGRVGAAPIVRLLLDYGASPTDGSAETNPLFASARIGDADMIQLLLDRGVDVNKSGYGAIVWALKIGCRRCAELLAPRMSRANLDNALLFAAPPSGDARDMGFLIDRGASVNAKDTNGRTALLLAAASDVVPLSVVSTLIQRGADVNAADANGQTALTLAAQRGNLQVVDLLLKHGANPQPAAIAPAVTHGSPSSPRAAVERALPALQRSDVAFLGKAGCVSCHNNTLTAMAVARARARDVRVDEQAAQGQKEAIARFVASWRDRLLQGIGIPGEHDTVSYILLGLSAEGYDADEATDAMVRFLKRKQSAAGHWPIDGHRPPIESSDIQVTAASMRSMQLYAPASERVAYDDAVRRAAAWLANANPLSTEDRAFQLLGFGWAKAPKGAIRKAARALIAEQRSDGGWSQLPGLTSDAYATGQALTALVESGAITAGDAAYRRGSTYLLDTQLADGSWFVRSRAIPIQPFFESGFPHGHDQFISAAATNWATMALTIAIGNAHVGDGAR
jgi:ankyrin repeat protein